jgi:hypothetical protein
LRGSSREYGGGSSSSTSDSEKSSGLCRRFGCSGRLLSVLFGRFGAAGLLAEEEFVEDMGAEDALFVVSSIA